MNKIYLTNYKKWSLAWVQFLLLTMLPLLMPIGVIAQNRPITGTVTDAKTGETLVGVAIKVQNSNTGTSTDAQGKFRLNVPANAVLIVSYLGYTPKTVNTGTSSTFEIKLTADSKSLEEVVVVGYNTVRKKDLTGAVTQIKPDKIADQNPNTVQDIIRGTPGLSVGMDPTAKGGGSIQIRGQRSVYTDGGHNDPLLILDGTIFYGELSEINPDDIEQIDVLKDASAAAVYGAKSANGVLLITTKKGKVGKPKINFTSNFGLFTPGSTRQVFSPEEYIKYRQDWYTAPTYGLNTATGQYEAYRTPVQATGNQNRPGFYEMPTDENLAKYGITLAQWRAYTTEPTTIPDQERYARRLLLNNAPVVLSNYLNGKTFDWYDHTFQTGVNQDYNISASGGSDQMNYYLSLGYLSNEGLTKGNEFSTIRSNMKINGKINKWLDLGANVNFQHRTDADLSAEWQRQVTLNSPFADYADADGNPVVFPMGDAQANNRGYNYDYDRQFMDLDRGFTVLNPILTAKVKLPFKINYSFNGSPRYQYFHDRYWESANHPAWRSTNGLINREQSERFDWSFNNTFNWQHEFAKKHRLDLTFVQEAEQRQFWRDVINARDITPTDALGYHETSLGNKDRSTFNTDDSKETADGLLGRLFYSYNDRYAITTSIRRDGYSAFGAANRRATFFAAAFAWTFTNEKFFKWAPMSNGKLRISWGQNGNRQLGDPYLALANLSLGANGATMGYLDNSNSLVQAKYLYMDRMANPNLTWEKTEAFNAGLDFDFLNGRISGAVDYFITPTVDMIMRRQLQTFTGFPNINMNLGKVENKGVELSLNTVNIKKQDFTWSSTFGFSKYKNTIKHLYYIYDNGVERDDQGNRWFIGKPIGAIWDFKVTGIWQANEAAEAAVYGQRPGDPKVENKFTEDDVKNANGTVTPIYNDKDRQILGQSNPPVMWSLRNDFNYKNLNFSFNMYSYWGHKTPIGIYLNQDNATSLVTNLANTWEKKYWSLDNPTNEYGRLDARGPSGATAPPRIYDRSFIRLENVTLGYTLPVKVLPIPGIERLKVFGTVRNVAVWTKEKFEYGDIETFDNATNRDDAAQRQRMQRAGLAPRTYTFGLNVIF
ncbi:SusC/RagA family TonB-linked outer membrane protein [Desertivirga brevis]|uniref:SusC/RagA family TonB-linked outer membrane protein n=1 Tax=Desertivirga brevis TaxID=2810310 RepID=UPI001A97063B|nr:SusC/RagA family TonB-linked outer membrane protein [Pedobacter sp. SYSU D00873]